MMRLESRISKIIEIIVCEYKDGGINFALDEAMIKIKEGYTSGSDRNRSGGNYFFSVTNDSQEANEDG